MPLPLSLTLTPTRGDSSLVHHSQQEARLALCQEVALGVERALGTAARRVVDAHVAREAVGVQPLAHLVRARVRARARARVRARARAKGGVRARVRARVRVRVRVGTCARRCLTSGRPCQPACVVRTAHARLVRVRQLPSATGTYGTQEAGGVARTYSMEALGRLVGIADPLLTLEYRLTAALALAAASRGLGELGRVLLTEVRHTIRC